MTVTLALTRAVTEAVTRSLVDARPIPGQGAANLKPVNVERPEISGVQAVRQQLSVSNGVWTGEQPITFEYEWRIDGASTGVTTSTFTPPDAAYGKTGRARVTATNARGSAVVDTQQFGPLAGVAPSIGAVTTTGDNFVGGLRTANVAGVDGWPAPELAYQWLRNGVAIAGATAETFTIAGVVTVGDQLSVRMTAINAAGSTSKTSAAVTVIFAGLDLDFAAGRYALDGVYGAGLPAGWTFARTGAGTAERLDGSLVPFATGVPRITNRGLLVEEARTNKLIGFNANPTTTAGFVVSGNSAVMEIVDDAAEIAAAGLSQVCASGRVVRVTSGPGGAWRIVMNGSPGNLNVHTASVYWRCAGEPGERRADFVWEGTNENPATAPVLPTTYRRYTKTMEAGTNPSGRITIRGSTAGTYYFILPQLEEGSFVTSPIVTEGAAATRGTDLADLPFAQAAGYTFLTVADYRGDTGVAQPSGSCILVGGSVYHQRSATGNGQAIFARNAMSTLTLRTTSVPSAGIAKVASRVSSAAGAAASVGGLLPFADQPAVVDSSIGQVTVGRRGSNAAGGYIRNFMVLRRAVANDELQALTA